MVLEPIFRAGDTYGFDPQIEEIKARAAWTGGSKRVFVAEDEGCHQMLGTYFLMANQNGPGDHVCNCGYAVSPNARGRGVASQMCEHSQALARTTGFRAMQFNFVAASNEGAVRLWRRLGFTVVGTLPGAFRHPQTGYGDAYIMFKDLTEETRPLS